MKWFHSVRSRSKKTTLMGLGFFLVASGTYNSIMVQSDAFMDQTDVRFVKRLDEIYGVVKEGRRLANAGPWVKLEAPKAVVQAPIHRKMAQKLIARQKTAPGITNPTEKMPEVEAAIKEDLSLDLIEVFNARKYPQAPKVGDFSGNIVTKEGIIEAINVSLPQGESIQINFAEMAGNVFEYEHEGNLMSGMLYQIDQTSYMVTLTNGPFEGTRLKFAQPAPEAEDFGNNAELAMNSENDNFGNNGDFAAVQNDNGTSMEVGQFGNNSQAEEMQPDYYAQNEAQQVQEMPPADVQLDENGNPISYGFNFSGGVPMQDGQNQQQI